MSRIHPTTPLFFWWFPFGRNRVGSGETEPVASPVDGTGGCFAAPTDGDTTTVEYGSLSRPDPKDIPTANRTRPMNATELRETIPALESGVYLNTGASGPSPRHVVEAAQRCLEYHEYGAPTSDGMYEAADTVYETARSSVARVLGTSPEAVALTQSTTDGINAVAGAIDWREGDVVVRTDLEHAAGILPWQGLERRRGIEVSVLETEEGNLALEDVKDVVAEARLLVVSSITWTHGTRLPITELVDIAHDAGTAVLVDAVQSPGQTPVDVEAWDADFVAAAGHKWLLGPFGSGFLVVRDGVERDFDLELAPSAVGYRSVEDPEVTDYRYKPGAHRFEVGTTSPVPHAGLVAAIDLLETMGLERIETRIERLTDRLKDGIREDDLLSPRAYESGLVTISVDDSEATVERLADRGIVVRSIPGLGTDAIRASVHAFNTPADVDALLEAL